MEFHVTFNIFKKIKILFPLFLFFFIILLLSNIKVTSKKKVIKSFLATCVLFIAIPIQF